jgi:Beta/Gamma crystallin
MALMLMAVAMPAAADRLTERIAAVCAEAVAREFRNRGRADHFEDHGHAFGARVYVNNRDYFNCHVSKDFDHYTLFDMAGRRVAARQTGYDDHRSGRGPDGDFRFSGSFGNRHGPDHDRRFFRGEIVVYEHRGFRGGALKFQGEVRNLAEVGINDAVSSVRVIAGAWEFCSDADYRGRCVVLERDEPDLADLGLNNRISSFRPIRH